MRRLVPLAFAIGLLLALVPSVSADSRCSGRAGVTLYWDIDGKNKGGGSITYCTSSTFPRISVGDLNRVSGGGHSEWNDDISAYETFNMGSQASFSIYKDTAYNASGSTVKLVTTGNQYVSDLRVYWHSLGIDGFNDQASSLKIWSQ